MNQLLIKIKEQLGWQGITGVLLLALAGTFLTLTLKPLEEETTFMHNRLDAARSKAAMHSRTFSLGDRQKELGLFFESLPLEQDVTDILASIYSVAEASGVEFKQADYQLNDKDTPRIEYGIVFPVQGDYAKIRLFVSRVLADHSAIALDQINFQRDKVNNPILKADIRMTLFLSPTGTAKQTPVFCCIKRICNCSGQPLIVVPSLTLFARLCVAEMCCQAVALFIGSLQNR